MGKRANDLSWIVGGAQGSGIDTSATIFSRACAHAGLEVLGKREFYSNIKGRHSYYHVMVSDRPVLSHHEEADLVACIDAETAMRHAQGVVGGGTLIYNTDDAKKPVREVPTLEHSVQEDLAGQCEAAGKEPTLGGVVDLAQARGVHALGLSYEEILGKIAPKVGASYAMQIQRVSNTVVVGASFGLLGLPEETVLRGLRDVFGKRPKLLDMNEHGLAAGYEAARPFASKFPVALKPRKAAGPRMFVTGNQAVALGKVAGGCRFQTYYPITPASDESEYLEGLKELPVRGGGLAPLVVMQCEDEISSITMATGAALAGARAATSTSGPGFSLMMEGLGWAAINEVPVVVTLYMRSGPSTGMPTRSEQGDLLFALHAGHGDFPRILLASGDFQELIEDAAWAQTLAEVYQTPVIHLVDKALAVSTGTIPMPDLSAIAVDRGALITQAAEPQAGATFPRFQVTDSGVSPRPPFGLKGHIFYCTGDEHDEYGHITEDPATRDRMMAKRRRKLELAAREIPAGRKTSYTGPPKPDLLLVGWGSPKGAILHALSTLESEGKSVGFLQVRLLHPFPAEAVASAIGRARTWACLEANEDGQLADLIAMRTGLLAPHRLCKTNGRPVVPAEVAECARAILAGRGRAREVLTLGR
ncbi:MAG TPA: 2-oxoacid:acceptor oxidoreductase subunit alpha [Candidatus Thermoplasmatota archaeon]